MRTQRISRYLTAMIIALGTSFNVFAQERNLKIYFNEYADGETTPRMYVTDDHPNSEYDIPLGVTVTSENLAWAGKSRFFEWVQQNVTDRVMADYVKDNGQVNKKRSNLKINFNNFPYEVNKIQWNVMNDLLSGSVTNFFDNYQVTTKCVQSNNRAVTYSKKSWALNPFAHQTTFGQSDIPWEDGAVLKGLKSFEISEKFEIEVGFFGWTFFNLGEAELSDKVRTFIKAGWNGSKTNSNITDDDDDNWAFKVKFTLPDIRMRFRDGRSTNVIKTDETNVELYGTITGHAGAVSPTDNPQDPDDFHYEFTESSNGQIIEFEKVNYLGTSYNTGKIKAIKQTGSVDVTIRLMRGDREVSSYTETIFVRDYDISTNAPQIAIAFADGNKGYDVTVGDNNAQIQGVITKAGKDNNGNTVSTTTSTNNVNGYHFEYTSGNNDIATINKTTGKITAKKEGDVNISAVLMNGTTPISEFYNYTLHVFAMHEGLEFRRINTYHYTTSSNNSSWKIADNTNSSSYAWKSNDLLRVNTSISGNFVTNVNDWKQIASFSTNSSYRWRAIAQEIAFDLYVPKYTKASARYSMAGNVSIGTSNKGNCRYGFELYYLNEGSQISLDEANNRLLNYSWDTYTTGDFNSDKNAIIRWGTDRYNSSGVGDGGYYDRATDNVTSPKRNENRKLTVYFAAIAYLWNNYSYPGDVSIGFKGIPEYTYYSTITYHKNDGTGGTWGTDEFSTQSKTETKALCSVLTDAPTRTGYTFLGWSTDPNPETATAEYALHDNFRIYDAENGGGMGPVNLYAVWRANAYTVTLHHNGGPGENEKVIAYYGQPMPESEDLLPLTRKGYDFTGYSYHGTYYYDADMKSARNYDQASDFTIYANWKAHTTKITFDPQGGDNYGVSEVTATYGQAMPKEGVQAPQRTGYEFGGYYSKQNGKGTQYYNYSKDEYNNWVITSARNWNIDQPEVTLYAYWIANKYLVTLNRQGGTGGTGSVTAYYGELLPSGKTAPTKAGYKFKGYYSNENQEYSESVGQNYGGTQYYDENMNGVESWDKTGNTTIYAHWAPATYIVTLDAAGGVLPENVVENNVSNFDITKESNSVMTIAFKYKFGKASTLVGAEAKKPGYELLGWFDSNGVKVIEASEQSRNCTITDNGGYWTDNGMTWNHIGDVTLTAHYRKKYKYADNVITFGKDENGNPEKVEPDEDWLYSVVNDLVGAAQDVYENEAGHPQTMVFDLRESVDRWTNGGYNCQHVMEDLQKPEYSEFISPNVLVYFNDKSYDADKCNNAILSDYTCPNLYVTDRYQMKIPYAFDAGKATYERNKVQKENDDLSDDMWKQSHESVWGTLCLPYPITNNNTHKVSDDIDCKVIFYDLRKRSGSVMQFNKLAEDAVIPANTPVLYERVKGVSSAVTIEEVSENIYNPSINVPANPKFTTVTKTYADAPEPSIQKWQFIGSLEEKTFCGKDCTNPPAGAIRESEDLIYYFKTDNFTRMGDKTWMKLIPYRAYFREVGGAKGGAKISSYSILVVDENGATDITDAILGEGEGDGKIYDLNGIRIMQPVKGRLYIVNGKKKVYE